MKKLALILLLALTPAAFTSCATSPTTQTTEFKTLSALGAAAKAGMDACSQLVSTGSITVAEWQKVADFYNTKWQPAFQFAVSVAKSDTSLASPDLTALAAQFTALVASYTTRP